MKCKNCNKALRNYFKGYDKTGKVKFLLLHVNSSEKCLKPEPVKEMRE